MKVSRSTHIALKPETVWAEVQTARLLQHIAWPLVRFIPVDDAAFDRFWPGERYEVSTAEQKSAIRRRKTRPSCYMPGGVA